MEIFCKPFLLNKVQKFSKLLVLNTDTTAGQYAIFDGINTWTTGNLPVAGPHSDLVYGNGVYVTAVQNTNNVLYSTDGINWNTSTLPSSENWAGMTFGNGKFVVTATGTGSGSSLTLNNKAAYSTDGINWTATTMANNALWYNLNYCNDKFIAISGYINNSSLKTYNVINYSTDGINWIASTLSENTITLRKPIYANNIYIAGSNSVSSGGRIGITSTDGINWTIRRPLTPASAYNFAWFRNKFIGAYGNTVFSSSDGLTWTEGTLPFSTYGYYNYTYTNNKYVVTITASGQVAFSGDGTNWTQVTDCPFAGYTNQKAAYIF